MLGACSALLRPQKQGGPPALSPDAPAGDGSWQEGGGTHAGPSDALPEDAASITMATRDAPTARSPLHITLIGGVCVCVCKASPPPQRPGLTLPSGSAALIAHPNRRLGADCSKILPMGERGRARHGSGGWQGPARGCLARGGDVGASPLAVGGHVGSTAQVAGSRLGAPTDLPAALLLPVPKYTARGGTGASWNRL